MALVSVLVPTFNRPKWLAESLASVLKQDCPLEVLVLDNGSDAETESVLQIARKDPRVKTWRRDENDSDCYGFLLEQVNTKYAVMFTDDDRMLPGNLSSKVDFLESHPQVGFVFGPVVSIDEDGVSGHWHDGVLYGEVKESDAASFDKLFIHNTVNMNSAVFRTELAPSIEKTKQFGPLGDWAFWLEIANVSDTAYIPKKLVELRIHTKSESNRTVEQFQDITFRVWEYWINQGHIPSKEDLKVMRATCLALADGKFTSWSNKIKGAE